MRREQERKAAELREESDVKRDAARVKTRLREAEERRGQVKAGPRSARRLWPGELRSPVSRACSS